MKTNLEEDQLILSSGRVITPNEGILGISEKKGFVQIFDGYDSTIREQFDDWDGNCSSWDIDDRTPFSDEEKKEIAEYIISLWKRWAGL